MSFRPLNEKIPDFGNVTGGVEGKSCFGEPLRAIKTQKRAQLSTKYSKQKNAYIPPTKRNRYLVIVSG